MQPAQTDYYDECAQRFIASLTPEQVTYAIDPVRGECQGFAALHDLFDANQVCLDLFPSIPAHDIDRWNVIQDRIDEALKTLGTLSISYTVDGQTVNESTRVVRDGESLFYGGVFCSLLTHFGQRYSALFEHVVLSAISSGETRGTFQLDEGEPIAWTFEPLSS